MRFARGDILDYVSVRVPGRLRIGLSCLCAIAGLLPVILPASASAATASSAAGAASAASAASASSAASGNSFSELANGGQQTATSTTPTATTKTTETTASTTTSNSNTGTVLVLGLVSACALLAGIGFMILRDAHRVAPVPDGQATGEGRPARDVAVMMRKRRAKAKAARRQRKRTR